MNTPGHIHLYDVSIDTLGLSADTANLILSTGITSVGDCIDFLQFGGDAMITVKAGMFTAMNNTVKPALIEHGYGAYLPDSS